MLWVAQEDSIACYKAEAPLEPSSTGIVSVVVTKKAKNINIVVLTNQYSFNALKKCGKLLLNPINIIGV